MTLIEIDEFFREHPLKESYFKFSDAERAGIAAVAERDVTAAVANVPQISAKEQQLVDAAIAEQTVFLMLNPEYLTGIFTRIENIGSAGNSRRFSGQESPLGQRPAALIAPLLERSSSTGSSSAAAGNREALPPVISLLRG